MPYLLISVQTRGKPFCALWDCLVALDTLEFRRQVQISLFALDTASLHDVAWPETDVTLSLT